MMVLYFSCIYVLSTVTFGPCLVFVSQIEYKLFVVIHTLGHVVCARLVEQ
jgi:hypothetical protein